MVCKRCLTDEQMEEIKHDLLGTCQSVATVLNNHGLDGHEDEVEDRLLDEPHAVELCVGCNWWHEPCDLTWVEEEGGGLCSQCHEDDDEA